MILQHSAPLRCKLGAAVVEGAEVADVGEVVAALRQSLVSAAFPTVAARRDGVEKGRAVLVVLLGELVVVLHLHELAASFTIGDKKLGILMALLLRAAEPGEKSVLRKAKSNWPRSAAPG